MKKIFWNGESFYGINKFDCRIIDLKTSDGDGGGYFTCLPISDLDYRKTNPTKASVKISESRSYTHFDITDDWGDTRRMSIPNELTSEIEAAKNAAALNGLMLTPHV